MEVLLGIAVSDWIRITGISIALVRKIASCYNAQGSQKQRGPDYTAPITALVRRVAGSQVRC